MFAAVWLRWSRDGLALQSAIAHLPSGIAAAKADRVLGRPDRVQQARGVLVNGAMFLSAGNAKATKYGKVQAYEQRVWRRGTVTASVFVDANGQIAGRVASD